MATDLGRPVRIENFSKELPHAARFPKAGDPKASCRLFCPPRRRAHVRPEGAKRDSDSQAAATQQLTAPLQLPVETMPCSPCANRLAENLPGLFDVLRYVDPTVAQPPENGRRLDHAKEHQRDGGLIQFRTDLAVLLTALYDLAHALQVPFYHFVNSGLPSRVRDKYLLGKDDAGN